jgi:mannose-6-phosphate isomerase-like protein (cupin superfamily)
MIPGVRKLPGGASATGEHADDRILAVVRGRLRVRMETAHPSATASACLRASDALAIPARTVYTLEAMQESEIFLYADRTPAQSELWGV